MNEHDELLTIPEVAATLRIRPSAVRRWIHERKITDRARIHGRQVANSPHIVAINVQCLSHRYSLVALALDFGNMHTA